MSSSCSITDSPNSSESLNGLTIGHKIYFEDVGLAVAQPNMSRSGHDAIGVSPTKKMKGLAQGFVLQQPPRCQVEGCNVDLSDVKAYYGRHKVCILHSKSAVVVVGGIQKRFCQQCSRFHQLPEFDQEKRSCRRRLAGHNERRRKPPPMSFLLSHYGSSSIFDTNNQGRGFLLDFSKNSGIPDMDQHHAKSSDRRSVLETQATEKFLMHPWTNSYKNPPSSHFYHNAGGGTTFPCQEIPSGEYYNGGDASNRALSLLSNGPWVSAKNRVGSNLDVLSSNLMNPHIPSGSWGYNGNEQPPVTNLNYGEHGANLQDGRQDLRGELSSRFYESVQQMHWFR